MVIDPKFVIDEEVRIKPLECDGFVIALFIDRVGLMYKVRYFNQGKAEEVYFFESELNRKDVR